MSINIFQTLPLRVGFTISLGALLMASVTSTFFYMLTYRSEVATSQQSLQQLVATIQNSAAIAAYLDNQEMADEVINGLNINDIVLDASLTSVRGMKVHYGTMVDREDATVHIFPLASPFMADQIIGELRLWPNIHLIEKNARQAALTHVAIMLLHSLIVVALVVVLLRNMLTTPLSELAKNLHCIIPGDNQRLECPPQHKDDEIGQLVHDINKLLSSFQEVLQRERALRTKIEILERRFRSIFEHAHGGIALVDLQGKIHVFNPFFEQVIGATRLNMVKQSAGHTVFALFKQSEAVQHTVQQVVQERKAIALDLCLREMHGESPVWLHCQFSVVFNQGDDIPLVEIVASDISERTHREQQFQFEAERDALTKLYNRRAGKRLIRSALQDAIEDGHSSALFMIDLDHFKPINDTYGHDVGDVVLLETAKRLCQIAGDDNITVRWGGDEFLIFLRYFNNIDHLTQIAQHLLSAIRTEIDIGEDRQTVIGSSIGIACFPTHGDNLEALLALSDNAMYMVKRQGRNGYCFHLGEPCFDNQAIN